MAEHAMFLADVSWVEAAAAMAPSAYVEYRKITTIGDFQNGVAKRCSGV